MKPSIESRLKNIRLAEKHSWPYWISPATNHSRGGYYATRRENWGCWSAEWFPTLPEAVASIKASK